jgi:hypothetical protein
VAKRVRRTARATSGPRQSGAIRRPVAIFGAGASKACGGPMTDEILPHAFEAFHSAKRPQSYDREDFFDDVERFLCEQFYLPKHAAVRQKAHYPGLPLLLSLLDTSIDRGQPLGGRSVDDLRKLRGATKAPRFRRQVATEPVFHASDRAAPPIRSQAAFGGTDKVVLKSARA